MDEAVGWPKLLRVRGEVETLADLTGVAPLVRAADRWKTLRKFAPALIEAIEFRPARGESDPTLAALRLPADLNRSGKHAIPPDAPMPFRKEWRRLVLKEGRANRRLYETAVLTTLRDRLGCDDVNALLAAILSDATNLALGRIAEASQGVIREKLI